MTDATIEPKLRLLCWCVLSLLAVAASFGQASAQAKFGRDGKEVAGLPPLPSQSLSYPGGRTLVSFDRYGPGDSPALERLRRDGSVDRRFGKRAGASIDRAGISELADAFVDSKGRILIAGERFVAGEPATTVMVVARLRANGGPDRSFAGKGSRVIDLEGPYQGGTAIAAMPGGRIVAAGRDGYGGREGAIKPSFVIALHPSGSTDASFGSGGLVRLPTHALVEDLVPSRGGSILAAASFSDLELFRLRPNGGFSGNFGTDGRVVVERAGAGAREPLFTPLGEIGQAADGSILVAGGTQFVSGHELHYGIGVARYRPNGERDLSYGSKNGFARAWLEQGIAARGMAVQPSGRVVVAGGTLSKRGPSAMFAICLSPAGRFEPGFGRAGRATVRFKGGSGATTAVFQSGRKVILAGGARGKLALARLRIRHLVR